MVGLVIASRPRRSRVNHTVLAEMARESVEIAMLIGSTMRVDYPIQAEVGAARATLHYPNN